MTPNLSWDKGSVKPFLEPALLRLSRMIRFNPINFN
jgi:hypothetical protein